MSTFYGVSNTGMDAYVVLPSTPPHPPLFRSHHQASHENITTDNGHRKGMRGRGMGAKGPPSSAHSTRLASSPPPRGARC